MFHANDKVLIVSCDDNPRAIGKTGRIVDGAPPGLLTQGRWTVHRIDILVAPVLCRTDELQHIE